MKKSLTVQSVVLSSILLSLSSGAFSENPIAEVGNAIGDGAVAVTKGTAEVAGAAVKGTENAAKDLGSAAKEGYQHGHQ